MKLMIKRRGDRKNFARSFAICVMFRSCKHMNKEFNLGRCKQKIPFVKKIWDTKQKTRCIKV